MIQLRPNQPVSVSGNLALRDSGGIETARIRSRIVQERGLPNPFTRKAEKMVHRALWTYVSLAAVITIIHNVFR